MRRGKNKRTGNRVQRLAVLAALAAIVAVLQLAVVIPLGQFTVTFTLVPIIVGAILYGPIGGAFLGLVFGCIVVFQILSGTAGTFSTAMLNYAPWATLVFGVVKGLASGFGAGLFYRLFHRISNKAGIFAAAISAPIINTGIFSIVCLTIFRGLVVGVLGAKSNLILMFLFSFIGGNFLIEFLINVILAPVVMRILQGAARRRGIDGSEISSYLN